MSKRFVEKIFFFCKFSEVGGYFLVQFTLKMEWFESRVRFKNLKSDIDLNNFLPTEVKNIWVPELFFVNTEERHTTIVDEKTVIYVKRLGDFQLSEKDENENIQFFAGNKRDEIS